jgi:hypothetical protein
MLSTFRRATLAFAVALAACSDGTAPAPPSLDEALGDLSAIEQYAALGALAGGAPALPSQH